MNAKLGQSIYSDETGFLGHFVNDLTDNLPGEENLDKMKEYGIKMFSETLKVSYYYNVRKVYSSRFGTVRQILVEAVGGLAWINETRLGFPRDRHNLTAFSYGTS